MKLILSTLLFCLLGASVASSATIPADSASNEDVTAAITAASAGDTVTVPAGTVTWTGSVSLNKNITVQGAGIGETVISRAGRLFTISAPAAHVTGFEMIMTGSANELVMITAANGGTANRWRISHSRVQGLSGSSKAHIKTEPNGPGGWGLIDNCDLFNTRVLLMGAMTSSDWHAIYFSDLGLGNDEAVYIEDTVFQITSSGNVVDGNQACQVVVRHCEFVDAEVMVHGLQKNAGPPESMRRGSRRWEVYDNTWRRELSFFQRPAFLRSGTGVYFNNAVSGSWGGSGRLYLDNHWVQNGNGYGNGTIDGNEAIADQGTGTHTGGNGESTLTDSTKNWTADLTNDRTTPVSTQIPYWIDNLTSGARGKITANTATTVSVTLSGGSRQSWDTGDSYKITGGYPSRDNVGYGQDATLSSGTDPSGEGWGEQISIPVYAWNNTVNGSSVGVLRGPGHSFWIGTDRDLFVNQGAPEGYTPLAYPHPLRGEASAGSLRFSEGTYAVSEEGGSLTINVERISGSAGAIGVTYATSDNNALSGTHYTGVTNTLSWSDAETVNKTFNVTIIDNETSDGNVTFDLTLSSPTGGATLTSLSEAIVTIVDDEATVVRRGRKSPGFIPPGQLP